MKKIFKAISKLIGAVLGNLDYVAAFAVGALAQMHYPELLADIYNGVVNFDYVVFFESTKDFLGKVVDFGKSSYDYIAAQFADAPAQ